MGRFELPQRRRRTDSDGQRQFSLGAFGTFRTAQGLINIAANEQKQFEALCRLVGAPEVATDPRFAEREARKRHRAELTVALEAKLAVASGGRVEDLARRGGRAGRPRDDGAGNPLA
jgi:crotonobetainyl-CoA:carnitine CoA-transferase CaiB-like acyl-CoA transferase